MTLRHVLLATTLAALPNFVAATDCSFATGYRSVTDGSSMCVTLYGFPDDTAILGAADRWNDSCAAGVTTPSILVGTCSGSTVPVDLVYQSGISDNAVQSCGQYQAYTSGSNTGGTITMYEYGIDQNGQVYSCADRFEQTLTHELGHALGMGDTTDPACDGRVMGRPLSSFEPASIFADDCEVVDELWTTEEEEASKPGTDPITCNQYGMECDPSPIIISVRGEYELTSAADGVDFDIDADGVPERIAWTANGNELAFLAIDRNGNGWIDDGGELFGDHTLLVTGRRAPNGFVALAELDTTGNGLVSAEDTPWATLRLWYDHDHDGESDPGELVPLHSVGVTGIETAHRTIGRIDRFGNTFRYASYVHLHEGRRICYDVYLRTNW